MAQYTALDNCVDEPSRMDKKSSQRFKLVNEGDISVYKMAHLKSDVIGKLLNSKMLRKWETHHIIMGDDEITSATPSGFMEESIPYCLIEDIYDTMQCDTGFKYCVRVGIATGSLLLNLNNTFLRDQWLQSVQWKRRLYTYKKALMYECDSEVMLNELKGVVELCNDSVLVDEEVHQAPLKLLADMMSIATPGLDDVDVEKLIVVIAPLVEKVNLPPSEVCQFFSRFCRDHPKHQIIKKLFTKVAMSILKSNVDFGRMPRLRIFVQDYVLALEALPSGEDKVREFAKGVHGPGHTCPHKRAMNNLVAVCLAAFYAYFEDPASEKSRNRLPDELQLDCALGIEDKLGRRDDGVLRAMTAILQEVVKYEDWRATLSSVMQPIPLPPQALINNTIMSRIKYLVEQFVTDERCDVHAGVFGVREGKDGWFQIYCPGGIACYDDGELFAVMMKTLINCCCKRRKFLQYIATELLSAVMLLAMNDDETMMDVLCYILEMELVDSIDTRLQIITTLESSKEGHRRYSKMCERQQQLREIQKKGGPTMLTLPSKASNDDLKRLLDSGSFGNLESLSLAFTSVTSECAEYIAHLPTLKYLNLWSTQFGDSGLHILSDHMNELQVLNLCETPVTDEGLKCIAAMKQLRRLNLNSTKLTALTFVHLKESLPNLQEIDVRYTEAW